MSLAQPSLPQTGAPAGHVDDRTRLCENTLNDMILQRFVRRDSMTRFVVGDDRSQSTLFPERLDDYLGEDNPVRAIDVFVDELDLAGLGFGGVAPDRKSVV